MRLSQHFALAEFTHSDTARAHGIKNDPGEAHLRNLVYLAFKLEQIRAHLKEPMVITSGYRNPAVNKLVGGSATSDHAQGLAADFHCYKFGSDKQVAEAIVASGITFDQLIYEQGNAGTWVHIGFGERMRQQVLSWKAGKGYVNGIVRF